MKAEDLPSLKKMKDEMLGMQIILGFNSFLNLFGIGSNKLSSLKSDLKSYKKQFKEHLKTANEFNNIFSEDGWITHDSLDTTCMKKAIAAFRNGEREKAVSYLIDEYSYEKIKDSIYRLKSIPEYLERFRLIEFALDDYRDERYYSVIPLLLMIIDGAVNSAFKMGFHTDKLDLSAWDSLTEIDGGIYKIRDIFSKGRRKTNSNPIYLPYRNGILHGLDLAYDNKIVAAKCWSFLYIVRDWINAKKTEDARKLLFDEKNKKVSIREIIDNYQEIENTKKHNSDWKNRTISQAQIDEINKHLIDIDNCDSPENTAISFMNLWKKKNFGHMSKFFWAIRREGNKSFVQEIRDEFEFQELHEFKLLEINDLGSGFAEVIFEIKLKKVKTAEMHLKLVYQSESGNGMPRTLPGGAWKISINTTKTDSEHQGHNLS